MLKKMDQRVLDLCTRFSHRLQRLTGLTNYFIAKIGVVFCFADCVVNILNYYRPFLGHKASLLITVISFIITTECTVRMIWLDTTNRNLMEGSERTKSGLEYIAKGDPSPVWRMFWLAATVLLLPHMVDFALRYTPLELVGHALGPGLAIFYYFSEVVPLPPGRSKVREWADALAGFFLRPARAEN